MKIVNLIHFIRGIEPRIPEIDLLEPIIQHARLGREHELPVTYLFQHDALIQSRFVAAVRDNLKAGDEIGVWLEVPRSLVERAGLTWRGRFDWDWHSHVDFPIGYHPAERERLVDVLMADFKAVFGVYPQSVGSWILDAHTLNYLVTRYGIVAACNCRDQYGTDGYTLWGGYWNQAYYPSRCNAFMPSQTHAGQITVPVFRMLGSDPIYQYDTSLGKETQSVVTLEPVYQKDGGGGDSAWVRWYFKWLCQGPSLAFNYTQFGQENSFGWPAMRAGLEDQCAFLGNLARQGVVRAMTLADSGRWFRARFDLTPATAFTALDDWKRQGRRSVWYNSRWYRLNALWENGSLRIRDIHLFREEYAERYLHAPVQGPACYYDTLPFVDGFLWSKPNDLAGLRFYAKSSADSWMPLQGGIPEIAELSTDTLTICWPLSEGKDLELICEPGKWSVTLRNGLKNELAAVLGWAGDKIPSITGTDGRTVFCRHEGYVYDVAVDATDLEHNPEQHRVTIRSRNGRMTFFMEKSPTDGLMVTAGDFQSENRGVSR